MLDHSSVDVAAVDYEHHRSRETETAACPFPHTNYSQGALFHLRQPGCCIYSCSQKEVRQGMRSCYVVMVCGHGVRSWYAVMVCGHGNGHVIRSLYVVMVSGFGMQLW